MAQDSVRDGKPRHNASRQRAHGGKTPLWKRSLDGDSSNGTGQAHRTKQPTTKEPVLKRVHCPTCRQLSSLRATWIKLPCRDCRGNSQYFNTYLIVRIIDDIKQMKEHMKTLHDEHTYLLRLIAEINPPTRESLSP